MCAYVAGQLTCTRLVLLKAAALFSFYTVSLSQRCLDSPVPGCCKIDRTAKSIPGVGSYACVLPRPMSRTGINQNLAAHLVTTGTICKLGCIATNQRQSVACAMTTQGLAQQTAQQIFLLSHGKQCAAKLAVDGNKAEVKEASLCRSRSVSLAPAGG